MIPVPFGDLARQYQALRPDIDEALHRVLSRGWFVLGEEGRAFEQEFAGYVGARYAVGVGSGTEAIHLALRALDVGPGDEVITVANTCVPTVAAISLAGATPVLVDVDPVSLTMDPARAVAALTDRVRAIVPVHLYGRAVDMDAILEIAERRGVPVVEDAAQAHGSTYRGRGLGTLGVAGCFSFYPSKNLGAYGDAGAVVTDDDRLAERLRRLRNYGEERRYFHSSKGANSRLDEVQAAILRTKLPHLDRWNARRGDIAARYARGLSTVSVTPPSPLAHAATNYHLYVVRCRRRDALQRHLAEHGITTLIHYPVPIHLQEAYRDLGGKAGDFPVTEAAAQEILSLPMFPELTDAEVDCVIDGVKGFAAAGC